ncbi:odorant receptor 22a-like [Drosophila guanche]|uniref:Odorant receptor n=1 Tax=Drosophila guanche TaxID=7266 RepID=A0A3B0K1Y0_DROGU|nr:odorant receptor 22a-like [Drosophila guanche]SPP79959.1 blast:Odorant receptor 22a [Drosophila guanche]
MLSKFFPRIKALPLTERIQSRDAFVYLDRYQKIFGWAATDDKKWRVPYTLWGISINSLLIFLLPISMLVSYIQMFKSFTAGEFLSSLQITVNMYGCVLKCLYTIWGYEGFLAARQVLDHLDLRCTSDEERSSVHRCVAQGNMCFVFYHILFSGFVVGNWTTYIFMGRHAWLMYLPGLDAERNYFTSSLCELLLMGGVVTMEQCTDVSPLAHMLMARCHINLLKNRLSRLRSDPNKNEEQHHEELRKCIQDHRLVLDYVNKLRPIFSGTIFVQFLLIGIVLGLSLINIMFFSTFWTALATVCFMFDVCLQTFPFCYVCNLIIEDCRELSEHLFQSNWLAASRKYKSTLIYFLHNLQQPIVLTAGGVFPICMQTNLSMVKLAFSVVTLIRQFNLAEKFQ